MSLYECRKDFPADVRQAAKDLCNLALSGVVSQEEADFLHVHLEEFKQGNNKTGKNLDRWIDDLNKEYAKLLPSQDVARQRIREFGIDSTFDQLTRLKQRVGLHRESKDCNHLYEVMDEVLTDVLRTGCVTRDEVPDMLRSTYIIEMDG